MHGDGAGLGRKVRFELARHTELGLFVPTSVLSFLKGSDRLSLTFLICTAYTSAECTFANMDEKHLDDDAQLAQMGHKSELKRHFSLLYVYHFSDVSELRRKADHFDVNSRSMLGLAFAILNVCIESRLIYAHELTTDNIFRQSWTALSASLSLSLPSGGSVSVVWGNVLLKLMNSGNHTNLV